MSSRWGRFGASGIRWSRAKAGSWGTLPFVPRRVLHSARTVGDDVSRHLTLGLNHKHACTGGEHSTSSLVTSDASRGRRLASGCDAWDSSCECCGGCWGAVFSFGISCAVGCQDASCDESCALRHPTSSTFARKHSQTPCLPNNRETGSKCNRRWQLPGQPVQNHRVRR